MHPGRFVTKSCLAAIALAMVVGSAAVAGEVTPEEKARSKDKPYPLTVCLVSDEKLGDMGDPHVIHYKGREIKFCCSHCEKDFRKDPKKFLGKLDKAAAVSATQPATQPAAPTGKHEDGHNH